MKPRQQCLGFFMDYIKSLDGISPNYRLYIYEGLTFNLLQIREFKENTCFFLTSSCFFV